jgi:hypothetical protein
VFAAEARTCKRTAYRRRRSLQASRRCLKSTVRTRHENEPAPPWERPRRVERTNPACRCELRTAHVAHSRIDRALIE